MSSQLSHFSSLSLSLSLSLIYPLHLICTLSLSLSDLSFPALEETCAQPSTPCMEQRGWCSPRWDGAFRLAARRRSTRCAQEQVARSVVPRHLVLHSNEHRNVTSRWSACAFVVDPEQSGLRVLLKKSFTTRFEMGLEDG